MRIWSVEIGNSLAERTVVALDYRQAAKKAMKAFKTGMSSKEVKELTKLHEMFISKVELINEVIE